MPKRIVSLILPLLVLISPASQALNIPAFALPAGASATVARNVAISRRARQDKDQQSFQRHESSSLYQLIHIDPAKRLGTHDEWAIAYLADAERDSHDLMDNSAFLPTAHQGKTYRYFMGSDGSPVFLPLSEGEPVASPDASEQLFRDIALGNTSYHTVIRSASSRNFDIGKRYPLTPTERSDFHAQEGSIQLTSITRMWERDVAEFAVETRNEINGTVMTGKVWFWVLAATGRPVLLIKEYGIDLVESGIPFYDRRQISFGFAYSDLPISTLAPEILPAQQPSGRVQGMAYSDQTGQLAFLTREYGSQTSWLTFWDLAQRKALFTTRAGGQNLHMTNSGKAVYVGDYGPRGFLGWVMLGNGYQPFGGHFDASFQIDRELRTSALFGVYPVSINNHNELEIWNTAWGKLQYRQRLEHSSPMVMATASDGRLVTLGEDLRVSVHELTISNRPCRDKSDPQESYCDQPAISFKESTSPISVPDLILPDHYSKPGQRQITSLTLHPEQPILLYCTEFPAECGTINYENQSVWVAALSSNLVFSGPDTIIADNGTYTLDGQFTPYALPHSPAVNHHAAVSESRALLFNRTVQYDDQFTDDNILIRDSLTGQVIDTLSRQFYPINSLSVQQEALTVTTGAIGKGDMFVLDLSSLNLHKSALPLPVNSAQLNNKWMHVSASGMELIASTDDPALVRTLNFQVADHAFTDKGIVYARDNILYEYDVAEDTSTEWYRFDSTVHEFVLFDEQSRSLAVRIDQGKVVLPHAGVTLDLPYTQLGKQSLEYDKLTETFFVSGLTGYSSAFNPAIDVIQQFDTSGKPLMEMYPLWGRSELMQATPNGQLWNADDSGNLNIRDIRSGLVLETIVEAHQGHITALEQLNERAVITASSNGTIKIWRTDIPSGNFRLNTVSTQLDQVLVKPDIGNRHPRLVATISIDKSGEFVINSPDGYYWSTPRALHNASFVQDSKVFDYAQYDYWLNRPDIVLQRLGYATPNSRMLWEKLVSHRQQRHHGHPSRMPLNIDKPALTLSGPQALLQRRDQINLTYAVEDAKHSGLTLHVQVNQVPVFGQQGLPLKNNHGTLSIDLTPGRNNIRAYVSTGGGLQSETRFLTYNQADNNRKPALYLLTIGVSDYADDRLDLRYAAKDATDLANALGASDQYREVHRFTLLDRQVTARSVRDAKAFLNQGTAQDHVVVFLAGHGFLDEQDNYFFGTSDIDIATPAGKGLPYEDINRLLDGIPSRNKLLMLDTCHSGEVTEPVARLELPPGVQSRGLSVRAQPQSEASPGISYALLQNAFVDLRASTGAIIISASGGQEFALETEAIQNGIFTASVIDALTNKRADSNGDGEVTTAELRDFTYREVTRLTNGRQRPTTRKYNLDIDFAVF